MAYFQCAVETIAELNGKLLILEQLRSKGCLSDDVYNGQATIRNGRTIIEHTEAEVIREIFDAYVAGSSFNDIAEYLTARKIPYSIRSDTWDKARIKRIIDNARYMGNEEYEPIIDEETYVTANSLKIDRQCKSKRQDHEAIGTLRGCVYCVRCGSPMRRRVRNQAKNRESWLCTNDDCGIRITISDRDLLQKITILLNRIISNTELLNPRRPRNCEYSESVVRINNELCLELERDEPNEDYIIEKAVQMASQLYQDIATNDRLAVTLAQRRAMLMKPQNIFQSTCFSDLIDHIALSESREVVLHTKTKAEIGDESLWK